MARPSSLLAAGALGACCATLFCQPRPVVVQQTRPVVVQQAYPVAPVAPAYPAVVVAATLDHDVYAGAVAGLPALNMKIVRD